MFLTFLSLSQSQSRAVCSWTDYRFKQQIFKSLMVQLGHGPHSPKYSPDETLAALHILHRSVQIMSTHTHTHTSLNTKDSLPKELEIFQFQKKSHHVTWDPVFMPGKYFYSSSTHLEKIPSAFEHSFSPILQACVPSSCGAAVPLSPAWGVALDLGGFGQSLLSDTGLPQRPPTLALICLDTDRWWVQQARKSSQKSNIDIYRRDGSLSSGQEKRGGGDLLDQP